MHESIIMKYMTFDKPYFLVNVSSIEPFLTFSIGKHVIRTSIAIVGKTNKKPAP